LFVKHQLGKQLTLQPVTLPYKGKRTNTMQTLSVSPESVNNNLTQKRCTDDLIGMAQPTTKKQKELLLDFSQLTHDYPGLIEQLAELVYSRLETNNRAASVREAFERLRWDIHIRMSNDLVPLMGRALLYVHPDLTGKVQLNSLPLDDALGMRVSQKKLPGDYARRLEWCDGRPLTEAPTPTLKKTVMSVRPTQNEFFEAVA
jgi:hypothetical protein